MAINDAQNRFAPSARRLAKRGFSFVEILFAVMILGIGFIMIAGIFPVAISQTQSSAEESHGASIARGGAAYVAQLPFNGFATKNNLGGRLQLFHEDPILNATNVSMGFSMWDTVRRNLILTEDPRYAWIPMWRRPNDIKGTPADYAQLIVVAVQVRNGGAYSQDSVDAKVLTPKGVTLKFTERPFPQADIVEVTNGAFDAVGPGAFLFPVGGQATATDRNNHGAGVVLRVGAPEDDLGRKFLLEPGNDLKGLPANSKPADTNCAAFVIGRGPGGGPVQDIAAYSTFIQLK